VTPETQELIQSKYQRGKRAFECGEYRQSVELLEQAANLVERNTRLGGEIQIWLVTAYEAAGEQEKAIALGESLARHPDLKTRKDSRRLVYILQAPRLKTRPEWLSQIPDLSNIEEASRSDQKAVVAPRPRTPRPVRTKTEPEAIDLSQVNTKDNRFVWVALVASVVILGSLLWLSQ
jgi:hypothetical protein